MPSSAPPRFGPTGQTNTTTNAAAGASRFYGNPTTPQNTALDIESVDPLYKDAVTQMRTAGITDTEINTFLSEQAAAAAAAKAELDTYNAQAEAARLADEQAFQRAQSELDSLAQQERDVIMQQQAQYESMQKRMQEEAAAAVEAARLEQERLDAEKKVFEEKAAAQAEKTRIETEGFQRTGAERDVARKRAGRSTVARPLLAGASASATPPTLGVGGGMATGGSLGSTGTLGVG